MPHNFLNWRTPWKLYYLNSRIRSLCKPFPTFLPMLSASNKIFVYLKGISMQSKSSGEYFVRLRQTKNVERRKFIRIVSSTTIRIRSLSSMEDALSARGATSSLPVRRSILLHEAVPSPVLRLASRRRQCIWNGKCRLSTVTDRYLSLTSIDLIVTRPLIGSQKLKPTSDKKVGMTGLLYIYK